LLGHTSSIAKALASNLEAICVDQEPLVSIIINNYNYDRFLKEAIDSALSQTYRMTEVIVVDDGSTDNSRQTIASYGDRIIPVLKSNGGQASAFNAGFARSHGELIIFLDADDVLLSHTVQRVAKVFRTNPDIARVQYRLAVIDMTGTPTGAVVPPTYLQMPNGDLRRHVLELNNYAAWWPPTSGNAFAAWTLHQILPMPELPFQLCADYYLLRANALCAPIISLDEVGAYYRFHGSNNYHDITINLDQTRRRVALTRDAHVHLKKFAHSLGLNGYAHEATSIHDLIFLAQRMVSLKLDARQHPIQEDTLLSLFWHGATAALNRSNASLPLKFLYLLWFAAMLPAPKPLARLLAEKFFHPETRGRFNKVLGVLQHGQ
jgi:glycosyltransferase involved in cell wall biosynthesis